MSVPIIATRNVVLLIARTMILLTAADTHPRLTTVAALGVALLVHKSKNIGTVAEANRHWLGLLHLRTGTDMVGPHWITGSCLHLLQHAHVMCSLLLFLPCSRATSVTDALKKLGVLER